MRWHTRKNFEKSAFSRGGWHSRNDPARILSVAHLQVVAFVRGRAWEEWCLEGYRQRGLSPTPWLNITRRSVRILHVFLIGMPWYESSVARGGLTSTVSLSRVGKCLSFPVFLQIFYLSHGCPCYPYLLHYPSLLLLVLLAALRIAGLFHYCSSLGYDSSCTSLRRMF